MQIVVFWRTYSCKRTNEALETRLRGNEKGWGQRI
jgi:hypothetical protein